MRLLLCMQMRQEMKGMIDASEQATTRAMTDMDVRMQSLKQKVGTLEHALDSRISEVWNEQFLINVSIYLNFF